MAASSHQALYTLIARQLKDLSLEDIQIEKIDGIFFAINVSGKALKGIGGSVYPANPIDSTGKLRTDIQLMAKIVEYQNPSSPLSQGIWEQIEIEARNDNVLFSSKAAQIKGGAIILMSKVPGVLLLNLIEDEDELIILTPIQRIYLGIKAIAAFEKLHKKEIFPRDITAGNTMIHLPTLSVTPIDLGYSHETELTRAPEDEVTTQSNIYSIALDILIPIFSGLRPEKDKYNPEITNMAKIKEKIVLYCIDSSVRGYSHLLSNRIISLIQKMCSHNPQDRGSLKDAIKVLEELARLIEKPVLDDAEQSEYDKQLRVLEDNEVLLLESPRTSEFDSSSNFFQRFTSPITSSVNHPALLPPATKRL